LSSQIIDLAITGACPFAKRLLFPFLATMSDREEEISGEEIIEFEISAIDWFVIIKARELRAAKSLSQIKLANAMAISAGAVGKIENPKKRDKYNIRHLNMLAIALKCSPRELLPEKPLPNDMVRVTIKLNPTNKTTLGDFNFEVLDVKPIPSEQNER
jgi:transcriptional regulator with XRE-family HTH domain